MRQALALVYSPLTQEMGSGFVVYVNGNKSYVLTAAHVVAKAPSIDVYFDNDLKHAARATVVRLDRTYDLALLYVPSAAPAQVTFSPGPVQGMNVGTLGYPAQSVSYWLKRTNELRADSTFGRITREHEQGRRFDETAPTWPGDSGGAIFSVADGTIVGMIRGRHSGARGGGYEAVGSLALREFLARNNVAYFGPPLPHTRAYAAAHPYLGAVAGIKLLRDVPGAHHFWMVTETKNHVEQNTKNPDYGLQNADLVNPVLQQLHARFAQMFDAEIKESTDNGDDAALGRDAFQNGNVGAIRVKAQWDVSNGLASFMTVAVDEEVVDKYGDVIAVGHGQAQKHMVLLNFESNDVAAALDNAAQQAADQIEKRFTDYGPEAAANFSRFGIPLADGGRSAFFFMTPDADGARVLFVYPYGTAARAGIQANDEIVALDGQRLGGLSADALTDRFKKPGSPQYVCTIMDPDGRAINVVFSSEDIRWYLEHPLKGAK